MEDTLIVFDCDAHGEEAVVGGEDLRSATSSLTTTGDDTVDIGEGGGGWNDQQRLDQNDGMMGYPHHSHHGNGNGDKEELRDMFIDDCGGNDINQYVGNHDNGNDFDPIQDESQFWFGTMSTNHQCQRHRHISYAQLFFDPATKNLVTIMEVNFSNHVVDLFSGSGDPSSTEDDRSSNPSLGIKTFHGHPNTSNRACVGGITRNDDPMMTTTGYSSNGAPVFVAAEGRRHHVDETLLTECSSISSATSTTTNDRDESRNDLSYSFTRDDLTTKNDPYNPNAFGGGGDDDHGGMEPIIFSHNDVGQLWFEENELSLYLLHDDGEPWDTMGLGRKGSCTDSLKKLLAASRSCISLRQLGTAYVNTSDSTKPQPQHGISYCVLDNEAI